MKRLLATSCKISGCNNPGHLDKRSGNRHFIKGLCNSHYNQQWVNKLPPKKRAEIYSRCQGSLSAARRRSIISSDKKRYGWIDNRLISNYLSMVCGICGFKIRSSSEIDHIVPIARNGSGTVDNLQYVHPICNRVKRARLQHEISHDEIVVLQEMVRG